MKYTTHALNNYIVKFLFIASLLIGTFFAYNWQHQQYASAQSCPSVNEDLGSAEFVLSVTDSTTYNVWFRVSSPTSAGKLQFKVNEGCHKEVGSTSLQANQLTWINKYSDGKNISSTLNVGVNKFKMVGVTENLQVDEILFVSSDCVPEGNGDNCAVTDKSAPSVSIIDPANGATVSGTVDIHTVVTDDDTELTVRYYIDDKDYGTASKNNMSEWFLQVVTENLTNGSHTLRVEATDSSGNTGVATSTFVVNNETAQKPPAETASEIKLSAIDDTFARSDRANSTNENSTLHADGRPNKVTYVKFELPANVDITAAQLSLYSIRDSKDTLGVYSTSSDWDEDTLTWNNRPDVGRQIGSIEGSSNASWESVDVTQGVDGNSKYVSFAIKTDNDELSRFNSKEKERGETGPFLYINTRSSQNNGGSDNTNNPDNGGTDNTGGTDSSSGGSNDNTNNPPQAPERNIVSTTHVTTEDAFARADQPTATAKTNTLHTDSSPQKIIYLKFNVKEIAGKSVDSAVLRLYNIEGSASGGIISLVNSDNWSESTLNWNNRPSLQSGIIATLGPVSADRWVEVDLALTTIDQDGTITLGIYSDSDDDARYQSKDKDGGVYAAELLVKSY